MKERNVPGSGTAGARGSFGGYSRTRADPTLAEINGKTRSDFQGSGALSPQDLPGGQRDHSLALNSGPSPLFQTFT